MDYNEVMNNLPTSVKLNNGSRYLHTVNLSIIKNRLVFQYKFSKAMNEEIKTCFFGRKFNGKNFFGYDPDFPNNCWHIPITQRNIFILKYMMELNPYSQWENHSDLGLKFDRPLYQHQKDGVNFMLNSKQCVLAEEMGLGKTLQAIECIERSGFTDWWWVGPKSTLGQIELEFEKWKCPIKPLFMTYEKMKKLIETWHGGSAPRGVIMDECSRIKTPTSQRSKAAVHLGDSMRQEYGNDFYLILMSGTPAPKAPTDWWNQCEVACPGFVREANIHLFRDRLAIMEQKENPSTGGMFPSLKTWRDSELKCKDCGELKEDHDIFTDHPFVKGTNEVLKLKRRLDGLVTVKFKKDCLDLPDKIYRVIEVEPTKETNRFASIVKAKAKRAITGLINLRELSDGFQYKQVAKGKVECTICNGTGQRDEFVGDHENIEKAMESFKVPCENCGATGMADRYVREMVEVTSPKDDILRQLLDEYSDIGRIVNYSGFTGSVDRCKKICLEEGWNVLRVDGRGWEYTDSNNIVHKLPDKELLNLFQSKQGKMAFVAHPKAAGMGLTLTASPVIIYYSNDFDGEARIQSEDRIHRPGMDENRGATIIDIIHLDSDRIVLDNLKAKRSLQNMTLGELRA